MMLCIAGAPAWVIFKDSADRELRLNISFRGLSQALDAMKTMQPDKHQSPGR